MRKMLTMQSECADMATLKCLQESSGEMSCDEYCNIKTDNLTKDGCDECGIQDAYAKLREYEILEETGRLVVLPCKPGDTLTVESDNGSHELTIVKIEITKDGMHVYDNTTAQQSEKVRAMWCEHFWCWCDDVNKVIGVPVQYCDLDCKNCKDMKMLTPTKLSTLCQIREELSPE